MPIMCSQTFITCVMNLKWRFSSQELANLYYTVIFFFLVCNNFYFNRHCVLKIFFSTGVDETFTHQTIKCQALYILRCFNHVQLFVTVYTTAPQAPLSMGSSRQEYWSRFPFPSSGDLPSPGSKPMSLMSPELAGGFFTTRTTWEVQAQC